MQSGSWILFSGGFRHLRLHRAPRARALPTEEQHIHTSRPRNIRKWLRGKRSPVGEKAKLDHDPFHRIVHPRDDALGGQDVVDV
jgi:hypothetical protein